jgi:hypothetical protein
MFLMQLCDSGSCLLLVINKYNEMSETEKSKHHSTTTFHLYLSVQQSFGKAKKNMLQHARTKKMVGHSVPLITNQSSFFFYIRLEYKKRHAFTNHLITHAFDE